MIQLLVGNCLDRLKEIPDNSVHAIVTDPPYEIGFMGHSWDKTGIANNVDMWKECLRVLTPGGYLLSFSGTKTFHRMACAIEDAGFEVRDMIEWVYSGFPKSLNIGKTTEFEGYGTALKPAHESICMARKPLSEKTVVKNMVKWRTGGINIDGSRIGTCGARNNGNNKGTIGSNSIGVYGKAIKQDYNMGRFPANLCWSCDCKPNHLTGNALFNILDNISNKIILCQSNNSNSSAINVEQTKHPQDMTSEEKKLCFAVENVDTLILEKILGKTLEVMFSEDTECSAEMLEKSMNTSLSIFLSGNEKMEEYQKVLKFITLTATNLITELKTCNLSQSQIIGNFITKVISGILEQSQVKYHNQYCWVRECFPESKAGSYKGEGSKSGGIWSKSTGKPAGREYGNNGSAARFFKSIKQDLYCSLCYNIIDESQLTKNICNNTNVGNVEKNLETTQATTESTAQKNATGKVNESLVQNVKSVVKLCDLCGTYIAQWLVGQKKVQDQELTLGKVFISEPKKKILDRCLASFVELMGNTDTTPTMENLNLLFGYVLSAIDSYTQKCEEEEEREGSLIQKSLLYYPKASKRDRGEGNTHATVKPTALMEYLINMVSMEGQTILDPFMGSGTTGVACKKLNRSFIGIEINAEYMKICQSRING